MASSSGMILKERAGLWVYTRVRISVRIRVQLHARFPFKTNRDPIVDGYGSKSTNSDLAGFYLFLYIRQHAGLFRRRSNV
jgi:hypothetical protein